MIIDCFTFFNELDLLEVRVNTLASHVDAFILCEGNRTFQGKEKPYVYHEHRSDLRFLCGKPILAIKADLSPMDGETDAWKREKVQRFTLKCGLDCLSDLDLPTPLEKLRLKDSDRIILSDVDEIPDLSIFDQIAPDSETIISWRQTLYYYYVNLRCWDWIGSVSCTFETFNSMFDGDMQLLRDSRGKSECVIDGGWHFSFLGGVDAIQEKIESFSHTEYHHCAVPGNIQYALETGWKKNQDLFGRGMMNFELMGDDAHLPDYLVRNKERFKQWWYR